MYVLGIDSTTARAGAALLRDGCVIAERAAKTPGGHGAGLLPLVDATLVAAGICIGQVDVLSIAVGPGSFTGLRVGLSVAKGLALVTGAKLVGVSTLEAVALSVAREGALIFPVLDARRGDVHTATFRFEGGGLRRVRGDSLMAVANFAELVPPGACVAGDGIACCLALLRERLNDSLELRDGVLPCAPAVAAIGADRLAEGGGDDMDGLRPSYVRAADAEVHRVPNT